MKNFLAYNGSYEKVPEEYWEYRLVEEHFRGNWSVYWMTPEPIIEMIIGFKRMENEASILQEKRVRQNNYGRTRPTNSSRGNQ